MIQYGLTKNMAKKSHPHDECDVCESSISKKDGRSKARMKKREELFYLTKVK